MTEWNGSEPIEETPEVECPRCKQSDVDIAPVRGKRGDWFVELKCRNCREHAFLQIDVTDLGEESHNALHWSEDTLKTLQVEWKEWVAMRKRHLPQEYRSLPTQARFSGKILFWLIFLGSLFFVTDQFHLLGLIGEDVSARQTVIDDYAERLSHIPCFSEVMEEKLRTVPIDYTLEGVYGHNKVKYGETGSYFGELRIKIHRSNFWFFGWPKKTQLINTLVHELRHRASPALGHSPLFYELVQEDTQCVLQRWD